MKVYLIKPKFPVTYWGFEFSNDLSGVTYTSPPLSLATIAALTPPDVEVEICDENIEEIDFEKECDIVGLTAYLMQGPQAFKIAEEFRRRGKLVVLGGPITGLTLEDCRDKVDVIFVGEAEYTWKQFIDDYRAGIYKHEYIQQGHVDMHDSPAPRMDLLKLDKYVHAAIQTTRGCPFGCEFCDIVVLFGRKVRFKSVPQVIAEMREAAKQQIEAIFFTDDNFIGNKNYAKELLQAIIEFNKTLSFQLEYMTQVSINLAKDDELMALLHQANFKKVFIGIETPRKASLQEVNKGQNVRTDLLKDVEKIQSYNISVSAGMIVGFDHDDPQIFQEQLDFIMEANIPWAMTGILQAVPKTPLYKRLQEENRLDETAEYFEVDNTALDVNIIPKNMTKEQLVNGYTWLVRQLYSYENYAKRVIGSLRSYSRHPSKKFSLPSRHQMHVVIRTLKYYLLTFDRKRRRFFCKIMAYTLRHKPFAVVDAMTYIVSFKHLNMYVHEHLEHVANAKASITNVLPQSAAESRRTLAAMYEELRKHAASVSKQASIAYEELRSHASNASKHAVGEYEELRVQAGTARQKAALAYEELAVHAAELSQYALVHYEELRKRTVLKGEQAAAAYDDLRKQLTTTSQQLAQLYQELSRQAAAMSARSASVSKRAAELYQELEEQARLLSENASRLLEELELTIASSSHQALQQG